MSTIVENPIPIKSVADDDNNKQTIKIKKWLNMWLLFGKYKNTKFSEMLEDKKKKEYLKWLEKQEFVKKSLQIILMNLINYHDALSFTKKYA